MNEDMIIAEQKTSTILLTIKLNIPMHLFYNQKLVVKYKSYSSLCVCVRPCALNRRSLESFNWISEGLFSSTYLQLDILSGNPPTLPVMTLVPSNENMCSTKMEIVN